MMKQIEGSADPKLRKGGTPHINTDMHNTSQFNSWKYGNTTTNRQREVMSIGRQANEKLHTPSMKSEMNVTFNKGPSSKLSQTSKKSSLNKSTGLRGLFGNDVGIQVIPSSSKGGEKPSKYQLYKGGTVPDKFGNPKKLNL